MATGNNPQPVTNCKHCSSAPGNWCNHPKVIAPQPKCMYRHHDPRLALATTCQLFESVPLRMVHRLDARISLAVGAEVLAGVHYPPGTQTAQGLVLYAERHYRGPATGVAMWLEDMSRGTGETYSLPTISEVFLLRANCLDTLQPWGSGPWLSASSKGGTGYRYELNIETGTISQVYVGSPGLNSSQVLACAVRRVDL